MMQDLRLLIREVLTEELASFRAAVSAAQSQVTQESVTISGDADLDTFVRRILDMGKDVNLRADILAGRHQFRLAHGHTTHAPVHQPAAHLTTQIAASAAPVQTHAPSIQTRAQFTKGMITERDINNLPRGTATISIGKSTRLTPLARDETRRRNIRLERTAT